MERKMKKVGKLLKYNGKLYRDYIEYDKKLNELFRGKNIENQLSGNI